MDVGTITQMISAEAQRQGVPADIAIAVANRESGFNPNASGASGEIGLFQLMPATAAGLGVNPYDLASNIMGGVLYLKQNYAHFRDWSLAIAGYNDGTPLVDKYLAGARNLPDKTIAYVQAITGVTLPASIGGTPSDSSSPDSTSALVVNSPNYVDSSSTTDQGTADTPSSNIPLIVFGLLGLGAGLLWVTGE